MKKDLEKFKTWLKLQDYANGTIKKYITSIQYFLKKYRIEDITEDIVNDFILKIKENHITSANTNISALKAFFKFLKLDIPVPKFFKKPKKLPNYITLKYLENNIIPSVEVTFPNKALKIKTIIYILFYTGMRKGELCGLKRQDFNLEKRTLKLYAKKTGEEKIRYYPEKVRELLQAYFVIEPELYNAFNLKKETMANIFRKLNKYNTFKPKLHCHLFRHSYAVHLLKNKIPLNIVQKLLGHKSLNNTIIYADLVDDDVKDLYNNNIK
jgi:integrase/recombinase XerC